MKYLQSFEANKYQPKIGDMVIYKDSHFDFDVVELKWKWIYEKKIGVINQFLVSKYIMSDINPYATYKDNVWVSKSRILRIAKQKDIDKYLLEKESEKYNL